MSVEKMGQKLGRHDGNRKNYSVEEISPFLTVLFKEEIDLAILQEIGILQQLQFSTCFIVCCVTLYYTVPTFNDPEIEAFGNIVEKGENAGNQHFLLFPQCFLPFSGQISIFQPILFCCLQVLSIWTSLKIFC